MKKADRQKVFDKYGGRCSYCGCELQKGWHVDEIEPCRRKRKWVGNNYFHKVTGAVASKDDVESSSFFDDYEWKEGRWVNDGYDHPDRLHIDNQNPACASCNINKHSMSLEDFRASIAKFVESLNLYSTQYKFAKKYGLVQETAKPVVFYFEKFKQSKP